MLILIAESKTMTPCDSPVTPGVYSAHQPVDEARADEIMASISALTPAEIAERARFSPSMALKLHQFAREFPFKALGQNAIEAYTGVVFKALDYSTLTTDDRDLLNRDVRIISSLYGWLRPDDIIKPYRLDYTTPLAPEDKTMAAYWRSQVTINLVRYLQSTSCKEILNLLPADAAKCIDWKLVKRFASVWKVDFKELKDAAVLVTPQAGRLKTLRGHLLREIIKRRISSPEELKDLATPSLLPMGTPDYPDHISFCV